MCTESKVHTFKESNGAFKRNSECEWGKEAGIHIHSHTRAYNPKPICFLHLSREQSPPTSSSFQTQLGRPSSPQPLTSSPPSIFPSQTYARTTVLHAHAHTLMPAAHIRQIRSHSSAGPALFFPPLKKKRKKNNNLMHLHLLSPFLVLCSTHSPHFYFPNTHAYMHACKKSTHLYFTSPHPKL